MISEINNCGEFNPNIVNQALNGNTKQQKQAQYIPDKDISWGHQEVKTWMKIKIQLILLLVIVSTNVTAIANDLIPIYNENTQVVSIAKLGVPSGDSGYAYQVDMALFSTDPLGFVVSNLTLLGAIAADEELSAIYYADSHSIFFPSVIIFNADGTQTELKNISLSLGADPFVWFYVPAVE